WFRNSTVVDKQGRPRVVYHSSPFNFEEFDPSRIAHFGFHFGSLTQAKSMPKAKVGGGQMYAVYLRLEKPLRLPDLGTWSVDSLVHELQKRKIITRGDADVVYDSRDPNKELREFVQAAGYDGVVYRNDVEGRRAADSFIVFEPTQIKSAEKNVGE